MQILTLEEMSKLMQERENCGISGNSVQRNLVSLKINLKKKLETEYGEF